MINYTMFINIAERQTEHKKHQRNSNIQDFIILLIGNHHVEIGAKKHKCQHIKSLPNIVSMMMMMVL